MKNCASGGLQIIGPHGTIVQGNSDYWHLVPAVGDWQGFSVAMAVEKSVFQFENILLSLGFYRIHVFCPQGVVAYFLKEKKEKIKSY